MFSQNFIPRDTQEASELLAGTRELVSELQERLQAGESFDNRTLTQVADEKFGGSRAQGRYTPRDAYDALEVAVNKHLLEANAAELMHADFPYVVASVLRPLMQRLPRQCDRTLQQTELQQFSTPPTIAYLAARLLNPHSTDTVLEPSAGTGSLAIWPHSIGATSICNEINSRRYALLRQALTFETYNVDAEIIDDLLPPEIQPTAILMNPPFSATGGRVVKHSARYGARHIESALRRLRDGGRLVAIAGEGLSFTRSAMTEWWQCITSSYNVRANLHLNGKEYGKYGTTFGLQIVVIDKTGTTSGENWQEQLNSILWHDADTIEDAWAALRDIANQPPATTDQDSESERTDDHDDSLLFVSYAPARFKGGQSHPAMIVESSSMAAVIPPEITYRPHLAKEIVSDGRLSDIQLERVIYAGQRHEQRLADGSRAGFFVGDGTGVGKGRILAAIIADNFNQGRQRALWLSVNNDLLEATRRDLTDLGFGTLPLAVINDYPAAGEITLPHGVVFCSYSSLIATARSGERRIDQIQRWLGNDAVVIFDEAHKAKNALASGFGEPTLTGQAVIDLQDAERNPDYRVVYSSATGATDVRNMAYLTRLGLWGEGTSFSSGFQEFMQEIESGGVGAMEMVSRDMKALGMYLSGSISFGRCPNSGKTVEYRERIHRLSNEQKEMYNRAAAAWRVVLRNIDEALQVTNGGRRARALALNRFWGDHQRFFRQVICAFKVPSVIAETEAALIQEKSIVISLVGTGEARTREQVAKAAANGGMLEDLDFSPRELIAAMVDRAFPTRLYQDATDPATGKTIQVPVKDSQGNIVQSKQALQMKQQLIDGLSALELPENPLDQLVNHFGADKVAELTGRMRRLIRDSCTGQVRYVKRAPDGVAMDRTNVYEMEQFQSGGKRIAIISDAASTGISLHASNRAENRQRRVHVTLELGWSADKQMQTFGRTHRSDQAVPPEYILLSTELGGEKRFSSTIARRLGSLGALTKGDRGAADNNDLAKYNFETEEGRAALSLTLRRIMEGHSVAGLENPRQALRDIGLLVASAEGGERIRKEDEFNVPRFLNRVLALDVDQQNALFDFFAELFDQTVRHAKANGTFDEGVTDIKALAVRVAKTPTIVHTDEITAAQTTHYMLEVDLPSNAVSFEEAEQTRKRKNGAFFVHRKKGNFILALESGRHTDPASGKSYRTFAIWKPEGARVAYINETELSERYKAIGSERARSWWTQKHSSIPAIQTLETHILSGAIIPLWQRLKVNQDTTLRVVRVITEDQQRIVGIQIPNEKVGAVLRSLGLVRDLRDPSAIFHAVLDQGDEIELVSNLKLVRASLHSEPTVELRGADPNKFSQLRQLGLVNEQINWKQRFFVPTDPTKGVTTLSTLLAQYPVVVSTEAETAQAVMVEASNDAPVCNMIDLNEWIIDTSIKTTVDEIARVNEDEQTADREFITTERTLSVTSVEAPVKENQQHTPMPWFGPATTATQLAFSFT